MRGHSSEGNLTGLPALDGCVATLRLLAPSGFSFAYNVTFRGPEFYHSEFPEAWQAIYEARNLAYFDPVLLWALMNTGQRRWSEIRLYDMRGVMEAARPHGLAHGALFASGGEAPKSILSMARPDRDYTDEEMALLAATFAMLTDRIAEDGHSTLTPVEIETLRCLRDGMTHAEAAAALSVSVPAIKARIDRARAKLGARSATQAVAIALQRRLI